MHSEHRCRRLLHTACAVACLLGVAAPALSQTAVKPAMERWRPKDGLYAWPDKDFEKQCVDVGGDVIIDLAENRISGHEWGCDITRLTDTAPGAIRVHLTCMDYNLAQNLDSRDPNWETRTFKEVMTLKKIDEHTMFVRKTLNGKFEGPRWKANYCPEADQRAHVEQNARDREAREQNEAAERKAAEERKNIDERDRKAVEDAAQKAGADRDKAKP